MHFIVHWAAAPGKLVAPVTASAFQEALKPYSWVRPLPDFYVVSVPTSEQYQRIAEALRGIAERQQVQTTYLLVSPPMTGGRYSGFLPQNLWPELNARSQP